MIILIDTNVFIAASIRVQVKESSVHAQHRFHDQSVMLLSILKKNPKIRAVTTKTVKGEAFHAISKAVISNMNESGMDVNYESKAAIIEKCYKQMHRFFEQITIEEPGKVGDGIPLADVEDMCNALHDLYVRKYSTSLIRNISAKQRNATIQNSSMPWSVKEAAYDAHMNQIEMERKQLERFALKHPNTNDMRILAEAVAIKKNYDEKELFIASCDTGFFAPRRYRNGAKSDL